MTQTRYIPKAVSRQPTCAFETSEEAWFWFVRCQIVRREGAHLGDGSSLFSRPCDPDDIYCAVIGLSRQGLLTRSHLSVLASYGLAGCPPDARCRDEITASRLWTEALDRLSTVLRAKGILN